MDAGGLLGGPVMSCLGDETPFALLACLLARRTGPHTHRAFYISIDLSSKSSDLLQEVTEQLSVFNQPDAEGDPNTGHWV